jgi:nitroreductase
MPARYQPLAYTPPEPDAMLHRARAFYEQMRTRRSVRDFSDRPVPREVIELALRTAATAPSGANQQPWFFTAVSDPGTKRRIRLAAEEEERRFYAGRAPEEWLTALDHLGTGPEKPFLETAPWLIAVFAQSYGLDGHGRKVKHYYVQESVGLAAGLLIAALHTAGLATLTHTPSPMNFLREILNRPENERPVMLVVTGYPAEDARVPVLSKKAFDEIARFV